MQDMASRAELFGRHGEPSRAELFFAKARAKTEPSRAELRLGPNTIKLSYFQIFSKLVEICSKLSKTCSNLSKLAKTCYFLSDFIAHLDQACGTLTLHSSLKDLVKYTQAGLDYLAKERESIHRARRI